MEDFLDKIQLYGYSNIWSDPMNDKQNGGPFCKSEIPLAFKLLTNLTIILLYIIILKKLIIKKLKNFQALKKKNFYFENILSIICFIVFIIQFLYKLNSQVAIYTINPCHIATLLSGIILIKKKKDIFLFRILTCFAFGCFLAIICPDLSLSKQPFEKEFYFIEHFLSLGTTVYLYGNYFKENSVLSFYEHFYGFFFFSFYLRAVLWPISELTTININYTMCGNDHDPFYKFYDKYYLIYDEFVLFFFSYVFKIVLVMFSRIISSNKNKNFEVNEKSITDSDVKTTIVVEF